MFVVTMNDGFVCGGGDGLMACYLLCWGTGNFVCSGKTLPLLFMAQTGSRFNVCGDSLFVCGGDDGLSACYLWVFFFGL